MSAATTTPPPTPAGGTARRAAGRTRRAGPALVAALLLLGVLAMGALLQGPTPIAPGTVLRVVAMRLTPLDLGAVPPAAEQIVWQIRVPRVLLAGLVGATLALAGTAYQGVFRNPLADPYLIGVAAGAGLGATIVLVSPVSGSWHGLSLVTPAAFLGALLAVACAWGAARGTGAASGAGLVLAGVAVAAVCNAATSYLFFAHNTRLPAVFAWLMGGFNTATWSRVWLLGAYALPCALLILAHARLLNVLLLDDEQARHVGVDVERTRRVVLAAASLAAAAAVSVSGLIGFVGLVVPHLARLLAGPDHRRLLPLALVAGAALLIGADTLARTVLAPTEIPVGIITALAGGPFFLFLLQRRGRAAW
jgi:iron complex transport system permease protein